MITGSINSSASLDGVTGSQPLAPTGTLIQKSSPMTLPAAIPCSTWVNSGSNLIATITVANPGTAIGDGNLVAIFWANGWVADALISSATTSGYVATVSNRLLPGGSTAQTALPATNTPILISQLTQATGLSIWGSELDQLLVQSTQPGLVELFDNAGSPVIRRTSVITSNNGFDGWPTAAGEAVPFTQTVVTANFYNNSLNTAITQVVALLY
jgi:hypothetical protein